MDYKAEARLVATSRKGKPPSASQGVCLFKVERKIRVTWSCTTQQHKTKWYLVPTSHSSWRFVMLITAGFRNRTFKLMAEFVEALIVRRRFRSRSAFNFHSFLMMQMAGLKIRDLREIARIFSFLSLILVGSNESSFLEGKCSRSSEASVEEFRNHDCTLFVLVLFDNVN